MPMFKRSMVILLVIATAAITGTMLSMTGEKSELLLPVQEKTTDSNIVTVYVSGEVIKPGVVNLQDGERVSNAVKRCGGVLPTADITAVNMAERLTDGMHIIIPPLKSGSVQSVAQRAASAADKININRADERDLDKLPGIGPAMAKRIIDYRTEKGAFESKEDLKKVRGIGDAKYERLKDKITI